MNNNEENILNCILPRLIAVTKGDAILALQIIHGPYTGVTFSFKKFVISTEKTADGMAPARFETAVHESPAGFEKNEAFDDFCSEENDRIPCGLKGWYWRFKDRIFNK